MIEKNPEKALIIFEINDLKHSNSWGKKSNYSNVFFKSPVKAIVYSDNSVMYDYTIRDNMNNILNKSDKDKPFMCCTPPKGYEKDSNDSLYSKFVSNKFLDKLISSINCSLVNLLI